MTKYIFFFCSFLLLQACGDDLIFTPKPRAFPKIEFPEKKYQDFSGEFCDFKFQYPTYAKVIQDSLFFNEKVEHPCWFDVYVADFDARLHCSYYPIDKKNNLDKLTQDAFMLAGKHNTRADYIDEIPVIKPNKVSGMVFDIQGPVASPLQFYLTDSTTHFLRGSLYFNTQVRPDSMAPVYDFMKVDLMHMVNSFEWSR